MFVFKDKVYPLLDPTKTVTDNKELGHGNSFNPPKTK